MPFKKGYIPWNKGLDWRPKNGFKKGGVSFNKGKTFSLETCLKLSLAHSCNTRKHIKIVDYRIDPLTNAQFVVS